MKRFLFILVCIGMIFALSACYSYKEMENMYRDFNKGNMGGSDLFDNGQQRDMAELLFDKSYASVTFGEKYGVTTITVIGNKAVPYDVEDLVLEEDGYTFEGNQYSYGDELGKVIKGMNAFTNVKKVTIYYNKKLKDLRFLKDLTDLEELRIDGASIKNLKGLENLTNLKTLILNSCPVRDISAIRDLTKLETILISDGAVKDIKSLAKLYNLKELHIIYNSQQVKNLKTVNQLSSLQALSIIHKGKIDTSFIKNNETITDLTLGGGIIICKGITNIKNLQNLSLHNGSIKDITLLLEMKRNATLRLYDIEGIREENLLILKQNFKEVIVE